ncbi:MAG: hypothetical protein ACOYXU_07870 [Nitrospirota bacterium]
MILTIKVVVGLGVAVAVAGCAVVPAGPPGHAKRGAVVMGPAPVVIATPPRTVFVTEFGVAFAPDLDDDVYVVAGVWYTVRSGVWYRADVHTGPWIVVKPGKLPKTLVKVKPGQVRKAYAAHESKKHGDQGNHGRGKGKN